MSASINVGFGQNPATIVASPGLFSAVAPPSTLISSVSANVLTGSTGNFTLTGQGSNLLPSSQSWTFSDLVNGMNLDGKGFQIQNDGSTSNTALWMTDVTGGFCRITNTQAGTFGLRYGQPTAGLNEFCAQYDIRRSSNLCSKQCKTYGWGQVNGGNTSNATFGCTMGGYSGTGYGVYYGDNSTGSNDATVAYLTSGYPTGSLPNIGFGDAFTRTPYPTQATVAVANQDISGNVWETWMVYFKASSSGTPDGEIAIWKLITGTWTLVMHMTNMWNCSSTTQSRGGFGLYEYSSSVGFHEDYRNAFAMFSRPVGMGI